MAGPRCTSVAPTLFEPRIHLLWSKAAGRGTDTINYDLLSGSALYIRPQVSGVLTMGFHATTMFTLASLMHLILLGLCSVVYAANQVTIDWEGWKVQTVTDVNTAVVLSPFGDLHVLSSDQFTILGHPFFPNYNVRIKKSTDFCDGGVKFVISSSLILVSR